MVIYKFWVIKVLIINKPFHRSERSRSGEILNHIDIRSVCSWTDILTNILTSICIDRKALGANILTSICIVRKALGANILTNMCVDRKALDASGEERMSREKLESVFHQSPRRNKRSEEEKKELQEWMYKKQHASRKEFRHKQDVLREAEISPFKPDAINMVSIFTPQHLRL